MKISDIIRLKMKSKISMDGFGGGSHTHSIGRGVTRKNSWAEKIYTADYVLLSRNDGYLECYKNRHSDSRGEITAEEFLDITMKMLANSLYNGKTEVFQQAFVDDAIKKLKKVLKKHSKVERMAK